MTDPSHQPRPPVNQPTPPPSYNPPPPGYGAPPPQPPKKSHKLRWGCLSAVGALVLVIIIIAAASAASSGGSHNSSGSQAGKSTPAPTAKPTPTPPQHAAPPPARATPTPAPKQAQTVTFQVSGDDGGAGVQVMYGTDSNHITSPNNGLPQTLTLPYDSNAQYYNITAQLQGANGSLSCSVTVQGKTKKGSASGAYQICDAQLNNYGFGWQ